MGLSVGVTSAIAAVLMLGRGVDGSYRFDPARTLVEIPTSLDRLVAKADPSRSVFGRDDFESVEHRSVQLWATQEQLRALNASGLEWAKGVDHSAAAYAAEMNRAGGRYMDTAGEEPVWSEYCGYECMTARLAELAAVGGCEFPFELYNIGTTTDRRDIWVAKVGAVGPQVLMAGNIHGDETTGGQLLQRWLWETCNKPTAQQDDVARSVQAFYMPMLNPDGYERNQRGNARGADLNRDFPTPTGGAGGVQPESAAYMEFANQHKFDISLMYHGGAVVCNYPYDSCYTSSIVPRPCPPAATSYHPRSSEVLPSSEAYARQLIADGTRCNVGSNCLVNGAAWYQIEGSLQDWAFHFRNTLDMTMEISSTKRVSAASLPRYYTENKASIHAFMMWAADRTELTEA
mmetsp:Transcript_17284/g.45065  ORF Transcript_17284/g.45065 Transcript_17284/m.45065 type:complete len:403 (-) Transcript_17284:195-1403(-)